MMSFYISGVACSDRGISLLSEDRDREPLKCWIGHLDALLLCDGGHANKLARVRARTQYRG